MTRLAALVEPPTRVPWIPPPPPLDLKTPIVIADQATLRRALVAFKRI